MHKPLPPIAPTRARQRISAASSRALWSPADDALLTTLVTQSSPIDWHRIARHFPSRTQAQVVDRWRKVLDPSVLRGSWTRQEDETILAFVARYGTKSWARLATLLPGRLGKQCRERWVNHLNPAIDHGPWTPAEDRRLMELHDIFGNRWTKISALMPTRSDNAVKNRWNSTLARQREKQQDQPPGVRRRIVFPPISLFGVEPLALAPEKRA